MTLRDFINLFGDIEIEPALLKQLTTLAKTKSTPWDLLDGNKFYYLRCNGDIVENCWVDDIEYEELRELGNVFLTCKEAQAEKDRRIVEANLLRYGGRRNFIPDKDNFYLAYDVEDDDVYVECNEYEDELSVSDIYFDTSARAMNALKEVGEKKVISALFRVGEDA